MTTLRIENTVHDFEQWKAVFDKYDHVRENNGVRAYRISRHHAEPNKLLIDLDFDDVSAAQDYCEVLARIWKSPQSQRELVDHSEPVLVDVIEERTL